MYDPSLSYEKNYDFGPFPLWCFPEQSFPVRHYSGSPRYDFFGNPVYLPFGIPAGPLLNSRFVRVAWEAGVSICTYKTVRSRFWKSHPHPNVLEIQTLDQSSQIGSGFLDAQVFAVAEQLKEVACSEGEKKQVPKVWGDALSASAAANQGPPSTLSISNSFGVPSKDPSEWQTDVRSCLDAGKESVAQAAQLHAEATNQSGAAALARLGRCLVVSFQGTRMDSEDFSAFVADTCLGQQLAYEAFFRRDWLANSQRIRPEGDTAHLAAGLLQKVPVLEVNLSCPNELGAPIFTDVEQTLRLLHALKAERAKWPHAVKLIAKIGALPQADCDKLVAGARGLVDGIAAINTVTAEILCRQGQGPALGSGRPTGGVCGGLIFEENLAMVKRLAASRKRLGMTHSELKIISVGGVNSAQRFMQVLEAGASYAQSATACMWNLDLCAHIAKQLKVDLHEGALPRKQKT